MCVFQQVNSVLPQANSVLQSVVPQPAAPVGQTSVSPIATSPTASTSTPVSVGGAAGIPQMLFLNQVTINGQTSFVLVDANNKPVQLPQGEDFLMVIHKIMLLFDFGENFLLLGTPNQITIGARFLFGYSSLSFNHKNSLQNFGCKF